MKNLGPPRSRPKPLPPPKPRHAFAFYTKEKLSIRLMIEHQEGNVFATLKWRHNLRRPKAIFDWQLIVEISQQNWGRRKVIEPIIERILTRRRDDPDPTPSWHEVTEILEISGFRHMDELPAE